MLRFPGIGSSSDSKRIQPRGALAELPLFFYMGIGIQCRFCGLVMSLKNAFYSWTPYGDHAMNIPPPPEHAHKECYERQNKKSIRLIKETSWIKPHLCKGITMSDNKDIPKNECYCHADKDGDCNWNMCPQLRDGEPEKSGRSCPLETNWKNPYGEE